MNPSKLAPISDEARGEILQEWYAQGWTWREEGQAVIDKMTWLSPVEAEYYAKVLDEILHLPTRKGRPGPKPDPTRAQLRKQHADWSDRTFATYWKGLNLICGLPDPGEIERAILDKITRPNGTFSVKAWYEYCAGTAEAYDHGHDEAPAQPDERGPVSGAESAPSTLEEAHE